MRLLNISLFASIMMFYGCSPFVPVIDVSSVPEETIQKALQIKVFTAGSDVNYPDIKEYIGDITAYSCKHVLSDPPASKGNALAQLRLMALELGANGIIDVTFDSSGTDAWGTNCWESVQASGTAVYFELNN